MPKAKLILPVTKENKANRKLIAESAAAFNGVKIEDAYFVGADELHIEASASDANNFFQMGRKLEQYDGSELKAIQERQAKKQAEKEKATKK